MFRSGQDPVHDRYTATIALLLLAFIASPVVLFASRPSGYLPFAGALAFSAVSTGIAWIQWKWHSVSAVPSIIARPEWAK